MGSGTYRNVYLNIAQSWVFCFRSDLLDAGRYVGAEICLEGLSGNFQSVSGELVCSGAWRFYAALGFCLGDEILLVYTSVIGCL